MSKNPHRRATISQVAAHAGVSVGTVSNYLNGKVSVSEERSSRIREAIDTLHYVPDVSASSLRRKETREIYVLTPDLNNTFYTNILRSLMSSACEEGYSISISGYEYSVMQERQELKKLCRAKKGSVVIIFNGYGDEDAIEELVRSGVHVILADRAYTVAGASSLSFDNETVLFDAVRFLKDKGYGSIGLMTEPLVLENIRKRRDSFLKAMTFHGYRQEDTFVFTDETLVLDKMKQGFLTMQKILRDPPPSGLPQAWIASSDNIAIGMLRALCEAGYRVPGDFGLIGFDNLDISEYVRPALTTISQDRDYFGRKLWNAAKRILKSNECIHETIPQNLIIRQSA